MYEIFKKFLYDAMHIYDTNIQLIYTVNKNYHQEWTNLKSQVTNKHAHVYT